VAGRAGSVVHAVDILKGRRSGDRNAAFQLLNEMPPEEFRLRNRVERREQTRMKAKVRPFAKRPTKRWTTG
jgi:hypothetical protein